MAALEIVAPPGTASVEDAGGLERTWRRPLVPATLAVLGITVAGVVIRAIVAGQSVFADELSTYWISVTHSVGGVLALPDRAVLAVTHLGLAVVAGDRDREEAPRITAVAACCGVGAAPGTPPAAPGPRLPWPAPPP